MKIFAEIIEISERIYLPGKVIDGKEKKKEKTTEKNKRKTGNENREK